MRGSLAFPSPLPFPLHRGFPALENPGAVPHIKLITYLHRDGNE
jgi:hypothetical protein